LRNRPPDLSGERGGRRVYRETVKNLPLVFGRCQTGEAAGRATGRGIPPERLDIIFERFQQIDASGSRDMGGTCLVLAICRNIVRQHGGRIWAESVVGRGSTFYFTVPRTTARPDLGELTTQSQPLAARLL
jgi:hypothetical protein